MSNLLDLYNKTDKLRPADSRDRIPLEETNFFDETSQDADGFTVDQKQLSPTLYTAKAQDKYNTEKNELTPPDSFDNTFPLHRYTPENAFYRPGESQS